MIKKNATAGDGIIDTIHKFKVWDKCKALELLCKHFGLLVDRIHVTGDLEVVAARLNGARKWLAERATPVTGSCLRWRRSGAP